MVGCSTLVQPLANLLRERLLESGYPRMEETIVQVLKESGKTAQSTSYLSGSNKAASANTRRCATTMRRYGRGP